MIQKHKTIFLIALLALLPAMAVAKETTPEGFLKGVYGHYARGKQPLDALGKDSTWLFEDGLLLLVLEDQENAKNKDEVPWLNGDPICNCQESNGLKKIKVGTSTPGLSHPIVPVSFKNGDKEEKMEYELVQDGDTWKIYDIKTSDNRSLRDFLMKGLAVNHKQENKQEDKQEDQTQ